MSKFKFHIRFSESGHFLHEHEVFEMMRSRNLYQVQFELKRKLHKRIRSLEMAEKMHDNAYNTKRTFFLTKMQERVRLRNKIMNGKPEKSHRGSVVSLLPDINGSEQEIPVTDTQQNNEDTFRILELTQENTTNEIVLPTLVEEKEEKPEAPEPITSAKVRLMYDGRSLIGSRSGLRRSKSKMSDDILSDDKDEKNDDDEKNQSLKSAELPASPLKRSSTKRDKFSVSFVSEDFRQNQETKSSKQSLKSRERVGSNGNDYFSDRFRKSQFSTTFYSEQSKLSDISHIKQLSSYEMGVSTPEGELILSRADYDNYMDKFRRAQERRLQLSRRKSEKLINKIQEFSIDKSLKREKLENDVSL